MSWSCWTAASRERPLAMGASGPRRLAFALSAALPVLPTKGARVASAIGWRSGSTRRAAKGARAPAGRCTTRSAPDYYGSPETTAMLPGVTEYGAGPGARGSSSRNMAGTAPARQLRSELGCALAQRFLSAPASPPAAAYRNRDLATRKTTLLVQQMWPMIHVADPATYIILTGQTDENKGTWTRKYLHGSVDFWQKGERGT